MFGNRDGSDGLIDWRDVRRFSADPAAIGVKPSGHGELADRTRKSRKAGRTVLWASTRGRGRSGWAPCAFVDEEHEEQKGEQVAVRLRLFLDRNLMKPLCRVQAVEPTSGEDIRYLVLDHQEQAIGSIGRVPPSVPGRLKRVNKVNKVLRHTWRIEQPGCPAIKGRNLLAMPKTATGRAARNLPGLAVEGALNMMAGGAADGGETGGPWLPERTLVWKADDTEVMWSRSADIGDVRADWFDRRLAFLAVLLESASTRPLF